jgi:hypothetical protein
MLERGMTSLRKVQQAMPEENNVQALLADGTTRIFSDSVRNRTELIATLGDSRASENSSHHLKEIPRDQSS